MTTATAFWKVTYFDAGGSTVVRTIEAKTEDEVRRLMGVPSSRIISIHQSVFEGLLNKLFTNAPTVDVQALILSSFSSQVLAGGEMGRTFDDLVANYKQFDRVLPQVRKVTRISEKLELLKFSSQVCLLARVGEQADTLGDMLGRAADEIIEQQKLAGEMKKQLMPAAVVSIVGVVFILGMPQMMRDALKSLRETPGINFKGNTFTDMLDADGYLVYNYWYLLIAAVVGIFVARHSIWRAIKGYKPFSYIAEFFRLSRGLTFIAAYKSLHEGGIQPGKAAEEILAGSRGPMREAMQTVVAHLKEGGRLSSAFHSDLWPDMLRQGMKGFDRADNLGRQQIFARILPLLRQRATREAEVMTRMATLFGMGMSLLCVGMIFGGLVIPMLSMTAGGPGGP